MRNSAPPPRQLKIRKYSNRRFYDTTRSRHVTLRELHELICAGHDLAITDSATGGDITNQVLTQIILERDTPKLGLLPSNVLHEVIRTQQQFLWSVVEQFFQQALRAQQVSQERWASFVRNVFGIHPMAPTGPIEFARAVMEAFAPLGVSLSEGQVAAGTPAGGRDEELAELHRQVAELTRRMEAPGGGAGSGC